MITRHDVPGGFDVAFPGGVWLNVRLDENYCRTTFPSGKIVHARYETRDGYKHDALHSFLAVKRNLPVSPALYTVAHGFGAYPDVIAEEEAMVLAFERFMADPTDDGDPALVPLKRHAHLMDLYEEAQKLLKCPE